MIRKQITFILLLISCFIAAVHSADDTSRAELVIKAYKPTAADDLQNDGGFKFVIIDALANSDDSSLNEINENRNEIDISNYLHQYLISAEADSTSDAPVLFSYRIEAALPDVEFEVSFDITPFENTAMDSQEKIDAKYSITNQSLNFPYNLKSENVYTGKHPVSWGIDYDCNHTLKVALSSELQLPSAKTDNGNASLKSSIKAVSEESHETNGSWLGVRCNNTEYLKNSFSDVWIARGAITMAINRDAYLKASNGRYEATVTARLEVVN